MNRELIRRLAITGGIYDCICDPYDKLNNGDYYSSVMVDLERFAEKIVEECYEAIKKDMELAHIQLIPIDFGIYANGRLRRIIKEHFGVEE